jgi:hypothetical protein
MLICKDCRCFEPIFDNESYCGECCIGETRNPIAINGNIVGCCLFEPKQSKKKQTNADRIRQMTDEEELLSAIGTSCYRCIYSNGQCDSGYGEGCIAGNLEWLRKEADEDAGTDD